MEPEEPKRVMEKPDFANMPRSSLFAKLDTFLPQMEQAAQEPVQDAGIELHECGSDTDNASPDSSDSSDSEAEPNEAAEPQVKMDLFLGVLEEKQPVTEDNIIIPPSK